jgi:hypothetical protein
LSETLRFIRFKLNGSPTVLWTGNGYHIYQPIEALILEQFSRFEEFENPSLKFIKFAEYYVTSGKSDPSHSPSFKSCMIRIPGTFNSKYPKGKNEVRIIKKWDGYRPPMTVKGINAILFGDIAAASAVLAMAVVGLRMLVPMMLESIN